MKSTLDRALAEIIGPITELRAVVFSAAPDGLLAWCWSRDDKPEVALGFAALDRAATACLEDLGASQRSRSLLLMAEDTWIAAWPLDECEDAQHTGPRLAITTVFSGALQSGMVMLHGARIRLHLRAALAAARQSPVQGLRAAIGQHLQQADDPALDLEDLAIEAGVELRRLARLDALHDHERRQLEAILARHRAPKRIHH